ncbi:MAG TPA: hypothetical protein PKD23_06765 [Bellilinea sp.]|nr:hypothetical protein [Bellilinea sp.]
MDIDILNIVSLLAGYIGLLIGIILFLGVFIESIVEAVLAPLFDHFPLLEPYKWAQAYAAVALGVVAAFLFRLDLIYLVGMLLAKMTNVDPNPIPITVFGLILTGLAIGKGSNYLHELIKKVLPGKLAAQG